MSTLPQQFAPAIETAIDDYGEWARHSDISWVTYDLCLIVALWIPAKGVILRVHDKFATHKSVGVLLPSTASDEHIRTTLSTLLTEAVTA